METLIMKLALDYFAGSNTSSYEQKQVTTNAGAVQTRQLSPQEIEMWNKAWMLVKECLPTPKDCQNSKAEVLKTNPKTTEREFAYKVMHYSCKEYTSKLEMEKFYVYFQETTKYSLYDMKTWVPNEYCEQINYEKKIKFNALINNATIQQLNK